MFLGYGNKYSGIIKEILYTPHYEIGLNVIE